MFANKKYCIIAPQFSDFYDLSCRIFHKVRMLDLRYYFRLRKALPMIVFLAFNLFYYSLIAQNKSDSLAESIKMETDMQKKAQMLDELANEIKTKNLPLAIDYALKAHRIAIANNYVREIGISSSTLGLLYSYTDEKIDSAVYWNKRAVLQLNFTKDSFEISRNYNRLGVDYILKKDYVNSAKYLLEAVKWAVTTKTKANAYNNLGMISKKNGNYAIAIEYYQNALKNYELINSPASQSRTLSNLGSLYIQRKEYLRAKDLYDESYAIAKNINDSECLSQSLNGLGIVTNRLGDPDKAINYLQLSANINKSIGLNNEYAQQILNIADIHGEQKKYKEAESEYLTVLKIFSEQNDSFTMSAVNNNLGDLYFKQKMLKKAAVCFEKAYRYSLGFTDVNYNRLIIKNLSSIYDQLGDTKNALKYMKIYDELNNKMVNVAENVKIVELNHAYDTSKKEKQIIQKTAEIQELQSDRKYIYLFIGILVFAILLTLYLYKNRVSRNQKLEENIQSIDKQISSLKLENQDLKMKLQQTESELQNLESKYSKDKEKLPDTHVSLSKREYEVLLFIAEGLSDKEIAEKIFVSVTTVRTHIRRIYDKLLVKNRTEAISMLHKYQLTNESA